MQDIRLENVFIADLNNRMLIKQNIHIKDSIITDVSERLLEAQTVLDCQGLLASPGFIDIHMHEEVVGTNPKCDDYDIANAMLRMGVTTAAGGNCGNNRQDLHSFRSFVQKKGAPINYLSFTGHTFARRLHGINDYDKVSKDKQAKIRDYLFKDIREYGAIGISYGLEYSPGTSYSEAVYYASNSDIPLLLSAHYRKDAAYAIQSIQEMIAIGHDSKQPMQISHIGSCSAYGMMTEALELIHNERKNGADIEADCYPYDAFSTFIGSAVYDEGCFELWNKSYDSIMLAEEPYAGQFCTKDLFQKVRKEYPQMLSVAFVMNEKEVLDALKADFVSIASDGMLNKGKGHPRASGSFPKVLGHYVREKSILDFYDALEKMTLKPALRLGLRKKGKIQAGYDADICIFDKDHILDTATYETPTACPEGIFSVIVNGKIALLQGEIQHNRAGKFLDRQE